MRSRIGDPHFFPEDPALWPINTHFQFSPEDESIKKKNTFALIINMKNNTIPDLIEKFVLTKFNFYTTEDAALQPPNISTTTEVEVILSSRP